MTSVNSNKKTTEEDLHKTIRDLREEVIRLKDREINKEEELYRSFPDLKRTVPSSNLFANSFLKRSVSVFIHWLGAVIMITLVYSVLKFLF